MNAEEIIHDIRKAVDCYYEDGDADNLIDKLEDIMMFYHEEIHPQGCGKSILSDIKIPELKEVHITQEQIDNALKNILNPQKDDRFKTILIQIPGFPSTKSIEEELRQELIKTIKDETSKP